MSGGEDNESTETVYQTPDSVVVVEDQDGDFAEEPAAQDPQQDIGASPVLGPITRSGRKRKTVAPQQKSSGKKNKTMSKTIRSPAKKHDLPGATSSKAVQPSPVQPRPGAQQPSNPSQPPDLAALLADGLTSIRTAMGGMETRLGNKIDTLEETVKNNSNSIEILTSTVHNNTEGLANLEDRVTQGELALEDKVADIVRQQLAGGSLMASDSVSSLSASSSAPPTPASRLSQSQTMRYWQCRRSLRLWPIVGSDLVAAVKKFLIDTLEMEHDFVEQDIGPLKVEKIVDPRSKISHEVIVEFCSVPLRDSIKASGFKLAGKRAGIRIEVPHFLKSDFNTLQNISYRMKMANATMKRSVKFDDDRLSLMLDIQLPGQDWRRIRPDQARAARAVDPRLRTGPAELTSDMISGAIGQEGASPLTGANAVPTS